MFNTPLFSFAPTEPWYVCTRKRGSTAKKRRQCIDLDFAEVGQSELKVARNRCCPKFLLTSLYECGSRFRGEEKSAAISLILPRGPRPQTVDGNVRSIGPGEGRTTSNHLALQQPLGKLEMRPALICYALVSVKT